MQKRTVILICLILGLSAVACTFIWCSYHRYYALNVGTTSDGTARVYVLDRLRGEVSFLVGDVRWRVENKGTTINEYNQNLRASKTAAKRQTP